MNPRWGYPTMETIAVLITCHNRKAKTIACLERLFQQALPPAALLKVYLVDDGCTDGTGEAVRSGFPAVRIIKGTGTLFWCRGMRLAWQSAAVGNPEFYLWLNDDTVLDPGALGTLYATWAEQARASRPDTVVVGSCRDPDTAEHTYGGKLRVGGHPLILQSIPPGDKPLSCDTFEGNVVLVPHAVFEKVGLLDNFQHAIGDTDYGYRVRESGCQLIISPGYLACCRRNSSQTSYWHKGPSRWQRWGLLNSRKDLPPRDWLVLARRHGGRLWFAYWIRPYLRVLFNI
jgi:GT2 family glycosyltransferase